MSQAVQDLPDPLEPASSLATSSPDDLLSKMADEAIDQLMADADKGSAPRVPEPIVEDDVAPEATPVAAPPAAAAAVSIAPAAETVHGTTSAAAGIGDPTATPGDTPAAPAEPPAPAADVKALLADAPARPSPLLWPLRLLNAPFAGLNDRTRAVLGLLGLVTLVPAVCAIAYVLLMRHR